MAAEEPVNTGRQTHEPSDVRATPILVTGLLLLLALVAVTLVLLPWHQEQVVTPTRPEAGPALLPQPAANLQAFRAAKTRRLEGYGWVDRESGIAHIPVERAVEILTQQAAGSSDGAAQSGP